MKSRLRYLFLSNHQAPYPRKKVCGVNFTQSRTFRSSSSYSSSNYTYSQTLKVYLDEKNGILHKKARPDTDELTSFQLDLLTSFEEEKDLRARLIAPALLDQQFQREFVSRGSSTLPPHALRLLNLLHREHPESVNRVVQFRKPRSWTVALSSQSAKEVSQPSLSLNIPVKRNLPGSEPVQSKQITVAPKGKTDFDIRTIIFEAEPSLNEDEAIHISNTDSKSGSIDQLIDEIVFCTTDETRAVYTAEYSDKVAEYLADIAADAIVRRWRNLELRAVRIESQHRYTGALQEYAKSYGKPSKTHTHRSEIAEEAIMQRVTVALGSNMGNRFQEIEQACVEMESAGMIITRTSGLWETEAMYFLDQDNFLNGVCEVWVRSGGPAEFLQKLQEIECKLGRVKFIDKGPRCIDLDILLWGGETVNLPHIPLTIPHKSILEREFVLRPLCQLIPNESLPLPGPGGTFQAHLSRLENSTFAKNRSKNIPTMPISTQVPLYLGSTPLTPSLAKRRTRIMSILNLTPDSFSDGGRHSAEDLISLNDTITRHIKHGVSIIDIGGQSSRPGAKSITSDEELSRILPAIKLIRDIDAEIFEKKSRLVAEKIAAYSNVPLTFRQEQEKNGRSGKANVTISIDTYRADVAKAAIEAGAHIINDISAGTMDPDMLSTVAKLGCTYILMHMRGTPETMTLPENTTYEGDIIQIIGQELSARVAAAEKAGIRRWRMILDPGIGFAKTGNQNLEILRRLSELRSFPGLQDMPWLVGTSRKGFIGKITGVKEAHERNWGTAATVTAAVQGGADIVRVHDVDEMIKVVKVADAIWRTRGVNP